MYECLFILANRKWIDNQLKNPSLPSANDVSGAVGGS